MAKGGGKKKKSHRKIIGLKCKECGQRTYVTTKNELNRKEKLTLRKHCPRCNKHTMHIETKIS